MPEDRVGFAVIYRWKLKPGKEEIFAPAWARLTRAIRDERGGLGSRLHRDDDGVWTAYAQWPDRRTWEAAREMESPDPAASAAMGEAVGESFPPLLLDPVRDLLVP
jgi:quinol monooxygenase YgiN